MNPMLDKLEGLWPEIILLIGACTCLLVGLAPAPATRRLTAWLAALSLVAAGAIAWINGTRTDLLGYPAGLVGMATYVKVAVAAVGLILLLMAASVPDEVRSSREAESASMDTSDAAGSGPAQGNGHHRVFDPAFVLRGEFFAFFLFSLTGVMLTAGANDLVWLFLALELTSLPTYVMVATARDRIEAQESAVKYFFLGAMAAAVFLYGFTLVYGAAGGTQLYPTANDLPGTVTVFGFVSEALASGGGIPPLLITGVAVALLGICFKIAAFPMHFYAADVYQGATTPVTAFLAFVPKTAGFVAIILLLGLFTLAGPGGEGLPSQLSYLLAVIAAVTMTVGNVLGLLQTNVKRVLAYSSIAHSGYMLVALVAGPGAGVPGRGVALGNGAAAVLFYLVAYALSTLAGFAVLGCLRARGEEAEEYDDISGLARRHAGLAVIMLISMLSLIGLPLTAGFIGKIYLFGSAIDRGYLWLVIVAVLNSAISAVYYLRIAGTCFFGDPVGQIELANAPARRWGAALAAAGSIVLGIGSGPFVESAKRFSPSVADTVVPAPGITAHPADSRQVSKSS